MKRLLLIPLIIVLAGGLIFSGCGAPAEVEDKVTALEAKNTNLLVTINAPLERGGRERVGNYYTSLFFVKAAAESGRFSNITVYFGAESCDEAAAGVFAGIPTPMLPEFENLDELCRHMYNELGVRFVAPIGPIEHHGTTVANYFATIDDAQFAELVANAGVSVGY